MTNGMQNKDFILDRLNSSIESNKEHLVRFFHLDMLCGNVTEENMWFDDKYMARRTVEWVCGEYRKLNVPYVCYVDGDCYAGNRLLDLLGLGDENEKAK